MKNFYQNPYIQALMLSLGFFLFFIILSSRDYMAVDGSTRCLNVGYKYGLFLHGNNHMLYPMHVFFWHKLLAIIGIKASSKLDYMHLTAVMNAFAASVVLGVFYFFLLRITESIKYAVALTLCYGFSRAFLLHATNSTEPTVGLFWSVIAICVLVFALTKNYPKLIFLTGFLLALAMATYQSMVLIAPASLVLCFFWKNENQESYKKLTIFFRTIYLMAGSIVGTASIYGLAYYLTGTKDIKEMISRFFAISGDSVYGSFVLWKFISLPVQFIRNVFPIMPGDFSGIVGWAVNNLNDKWWYWACLVYGLILILVFQSIFYTLKLKEKMNWKEKIAIQAAIAALIFPLLAAAYWFPGYDKLWLQPNFCLILIVGVLIKYVSKNLNKTLNKNSNKILISLAFFILFLEVFSNLIWLIPSRFQENKALTGAKEVSEIVKSPPDLVIDGWDFVSLLYGALWSHHIYNFHSAVEAKGKGVLDELPKLIEETKKRGGKVYFIGVLEESEGAWSWFLGPRGLPYNSLDEYRQKAKLVKHFKFSAFESSLYVLEFDENKEKNKELN
ncbi:MAG: hypothetical protein HY819_09200 [Acidobacteria bacterium]|nr:hypothetical protein [Acidobacteriota bacterium]